MSLWNTFRLFSCFYLNSTISICIIFTLYHILKALQRWQSTQEDLCKLRADAVQFIQGSAITGPRVPGMLSNTCTQLLPCSYPPPSCICSGASKKSWKMEIKDVISVQKFFEIHVKFFFAMTSISGTFWRPVGWPNIILLPMFVI